MNQDPYPGVKHRFHIDARTGVKIHYVEAGDTCVESELVVMVSSQDPNKSKSDAETMLLCSSTGFQMYVHSEIKTTSGFSQS